MRKPVVRLDPDNTPGLLAKSLDHVHDLDDVCLWNNYGPMCGEPGWDCSSGCTTKDHRSYGECIRSKNLGAQGMETAPSVFSTNTKGA